MLGFSPHLYLAALGPLTELFGVVLIFAVFALLRSQADRRGYFQAWERSWVLLAAALLSGLCYERFVDSNSVFYPQSPTTTFVLGALYMGGAPRFSCVRRHGRQHAGARARHEVAMASGIRRGRCACVHARYAA
ncbi:MAG: hypothetical protein FJ202_10530 [Gemmatimonadetes bacterium]|nr:hypothetical protein [Gemmatimonadota bacterium]